MKPSAYALIIFLFLYSHSLWAQPESPEPNSEHLKSGKPFIYLLKPDPRGGKAYKLVYMVTVPIDTFWKFKTDFDNDFLLTNRYIGHHRMLRHNGKVVITENTYTNAPGVIFRWKTTIIPEKHRLEFTLTNPEKCGQKFHYGYILLEAMGENTKVTHVAYFDFFGATLWVHYPWAGGMSDFLKYTTQWEQTTILQLKDNYRNTK